MLPLEVLIEKAQTLNKGKKYSEVIDLLPDEVLETYQSADLYAEKAQAFYRTEKKDFCSESLEKALKIDVNNAKANTYKGNIYVELKQYDKAIESFKKAIKTDSQYAIPYHGLGIIFRNLKEYDKAIENYNIAIEIDAKFAHPYNGLGNVYIDLKKYDKAIESFNKAIEIDPKFITSYNNLGNLYLDIKKYDKAIETFNKAVNLDPKFVNSYNGLGNVYLNLKNYDKAIESFNKAIGINPTFVTSYNGLGNVYYQLNEFNKAIDIYAKSIDIDIEYASPFYNRAMCNNILKNYQKALIDYEKYIELTQNNPDYFTSAAQSKIIELKKIIKSTEYNSISELVKKIKTLLLFRDDCVTHYTSLSVAKALILDKSKFRLSEGAFLNDTSEGRELFKFLPSIDSTSKKKNDTFALPFVQKPFFGSFVSEIKHDDLTLWRMYGKENKDEARGCAITLDKGKLLENLKESLINDGKTEITEKMDEEFCFYRVAYRKDGHEEFLIIPGASVEDQKSLNDHMLDLANKVKIFRSKRRKSPDIQNVLELLNSIAYLFKSAEYQYEHELRLVVEGNVFKKIINSDSNQLRVYIELVPICPFISKITLGPKVERAEEWAAAFYYSLDERGYHPEILISHLPFK